MKTLFKTAFCGFVLLTGLLKTYGQRGKTGWPEEITLKLLNLTIDDGLSRGYTGCAVQDHEGFLWVSTADGLNRHDGYNFKIFKNSPDTSSIGSNFTGRVFIDENGSIWIALSNGGLDLYDRDAGIFRHIIPAEAQGNDVPDVGKMEILGGCSGGIVVVMNHKVGLVEVPRQPARSGIQKDGIGKDNFKASVHWLTPAPNSSHFTWDANTRDVVRTRGKIWLTDLHSSLFELRIDGPHKQYAFVETTLPSRLIPPGKSKACGPMLAFDEHKKQLYFQQYNNIYCMNETTGEIELFMENTGLAVFTPTAVDNKGNIWLSTFGYLCKLDVSQKKMFYINSDDPNIEKKKYGTSAGCFIDRAGNIWVCTTGYGLIKVKLRNTNFSHIKSDDDSQLSTQGIYRSPSGRLYVMSWTAGEYFFDTTSEKLLRSPIRFHSADLIYKEKKLGAVPVFVPGKPVLPPSLLQKGNYFLRKWNFTKIGIIDPEAGFAKLLYTDPNDFPHNFLLSKSQKAWFQLRKNMFRSVDLATGTIQDISLPTGGGAFAYGAAEDSSGRLWFGISNGVGVYNPLQNTWKLFSTAVNHLPTGKILSICFSDQWPETAWLGYEGKGFCSLNFNTGKCNLYEDINTRVNSVIYGILPDRLGNLWMSTNRGLAAFNPKDNLLINYTYRDGLQSNEFNRYSAVVTNNNHLLFGGVNGLNYFNPAQVGPDAFDVTIQLTNVLLNNKEVISWSAHPGVEVEVKDSVQHIILQHNQNLLTFSFATSDLTTPDQNLFSYKMEGIDNEWSPPSPKHEATYTYLPPGDYTFRIKGTNRDGIWGSKEATLHFTILPPWWQTWWFRLLMLLAVCAILYSIYRYRMNQVLKLQAIRNKISADMHDEIGSTLSSISFYSQALLLQNADEQQKQVLEKIKTNAQHVQEGLSDIIWSVKANMDSTDNLFNKMQHTGQELLEPKGIHFTFRYDEKLEHQTLDMDTRKNFYLIFKEAVNNAAKYSGADTIQVTVEKREGKTIMKVKDNGKGFDTEVQKNGNGLGNMQHRAAAMKGELQIESAPGEGTIIMLKF